jgi:hypothetical protein
MRCDPRQPVQTREFFGSVTSLRADILGTREATRILEALDLGSFGDGEGEDRLMILRHTLMNPYLIDRENGISYIDRYFAFLKRLLGRLEAAA